MRFLPAGVVLLIFVLLFLLIASMKPEAQPKHTWTYESCYTNECIANRLNSLSPEAAAEAKLTTWNNFTYVWYWQ